MTATAPMAPTAPGVRCWWGIPYAIGERYRRPVLVDFDPDRAYDRKGVAPVQPDTGDWLEADSGTGEDCLNLHVWAPEQSAGKALPVAVYVFGGGFEYGTNTQITSNAAGLAASGRVVSVSINYRLGALGAVSLSQYGGALAEASNLCLQDVIAALTGSSRTSPTSAAILTTSPFTVTAPAPTPRSGCSARPRRTACTGAWPGSPPGRLACSRPGGPRNSRTGSSPNSASPTA
jgi:Carboxylesterase family